MSNTGNDFFPMYFPPKYKLCSAKDFAFQYRPHEMKIPMFLNLKNESEPEDNLMRAIGASMIYFRYNKKQTIQEPKIFEKQVTQ